jgi:hypothetical protein
MYNMFAYANNYVTLYDTSLNSLGCYNVQVSSYNPNVSYEKYWIGTGYTPNLVNVYENCGCTGRTEFDIVQETPTDERIFYYSALDCETSAVTYTFISTIAELSGGSLSYKIYNSGTTQSICVFDIEPTFVQVTPWTYLSAYTSCEECSSVSATPTPTPTNTTTPTPTSTNIADNCVCYEYLNDGEETGINSITYLDCNYVSQSINNIPLGVSGYFCAILDSYTATPGLTVTRVSETFCGGCIEGTTPTPTTTPTQTPTPSSTSDGTTPTPTATATPTETPGTPTPTPTPTITPSPQIYTHGFVRATCSDYCNTNYNINVLNNATADYASLTIGDTIFGQGGVAGFVAYSNTSTDTTTGPFRIADIDTSGVIQGIYICVGGTCDPL